MAKPADWEILDGLPTYGPMVEPFPATGREKHREGLVVRFMLPTGSWVGNFQRGLSSLDEVFAHPDGQHLVVVAGGTAYVLDAEGHNVVARFGDDIKQIVLVPESDFVVLGNGLWFEALGPTGTVWRSRRISWDGMRNVALTHGTLHGEAYEPDGRDGAWYPFEVDVMTGSVSGGSYNGPPM